MLLIKKAILGYVDRLFCFLDEKVAIPRYGVLSFDFL